MNASIVLLALLLGCVFAETQNVFLAQLTAEGARSNTGPNPFDTEFEYGPHEITSMGLRQHYLVGYDLAYNYREKLKLNRVYSPWQVAIRSTNHNYTLMGAQSELEALFPPEAREDLSKDQAELAVPPGNIDSIKDEIDDLEYKIMPKNFQTLPIHAQDFNKDTVLMQEWCSKVSDITDKSVQDKEWEEAITKNYTEAIQAFSAFMEKDNMTVHEIYPYLDAVYSSEFNQHDISPLDTHYTQLMQLRLDYMNKLWSNEEARKIFINGFTIDLAR